MHADFPPCAYIMASARHGTLYTGVTSHLIQRVCQHRGGGFDGFTKRYGVRTLVWFELAGTMHAAITREKQIKNWQRKWGCRRSADERSDVPPFLSFVMPDLIRHPFLRPLHGPRIKSGVTNEGWSMA